MAHVVAPDHVGAVGEAARMLVVRGAQQQRRRVDRAARDHDDVGGVAFRAAPFASHLRRAVTSRPDALVSSRDTYALVSSVTLGC